MEYLKPEALVEKWAPVLNHDGMEAITDTHRRQVTAVLLENQERALREDRQMLNEAAPNSVSGNVDKYDPVLISMVRRSAPQLIAYDICGVQPMTMPTGLVFAMTARYTDKNGNEALFNEADSAFTGTGTQAGSSPVNGTTGLDPWDASPGYGAGGPVSTAVGEGDVTAQMSFRIDKHSVTAKTRALKAEYSLELQQDLKAVHSMDAEAELSNILSTEILAEINREVVRTMYKIAKPGAQECTTAGTFDLDVDANGRWSVERFKGLMFQIEREANRIAQTTRRGRGNFLLVSADVASALAMTGLLDYKTGVSANLNVDESSVTFAGILNGKYKVYVDPYASSAVGDQYAMVGYKGTSAFDAGLFYSPYVPLQLMRATDPATFQPKIGFKTRYALSGHPLGGLGDLAQQQASQTLTAQSSAYYRLLKISNLA